MSRDLTDIEMQGVLQKQLYGHLGCILPDHRMYIVPITYAYHNDALYSFSFPGLKIEALRQRPSVCFQVEQFVSEGNWYSVIVWGTYEELPAEQHFPAIDILCNRLQLEGGTATSAMYQQQPSDQELLTEASRVLQKEESILYRIRIEQKTGKHIRFD